MPVGIRNPNYPIDIDHFLYRLMRYVTLLNRYTERKWKRKLQAGAAGSENRPSTICGLRVKSCTVSQR